MRTSGTHTLPTRSPCRLQNACGAISPKMTIRRVDEMKPTTPPALSASNIDRRAFTATFPNSKVQSKRFPFCRMGYIFFAYSAFCLSSPDMTISSPVISKLMTPSVRPLNMDDMASRITISMICIASGRKFNGFPDGHSCWNCSQHDGVHNISGSPCSCKRRDSLRCEKEFDSARFVFLSSNEIIKIIKRVGMKTTRSKTERNRSRMPFFLVRWCGCVII